MNDIERNLKHALRRCDPPANFANRILARVAAEDEELARRRPHLLGLRWPSLSWGWAIAAIALLIACATGYRVHESRVEEAEALAARRQVMVALRITGAKLRIAKQRVRAVEEGQEKTGKTL
jgi:hypothetical protein